MIVFMATVILLMSGFHNNEQEKVCRTAACVKTAAMVKEAMNETANPCDDFYEFACRGWITNNPMPKHASFWSTLRVIEKEIEFRLYKILKTPDKEEDGRPIKMARSLYRSCMDRKSVEKLGYKPLNDAFTKLGLPIRPPSDEEAENLDISKIAGSALRHYDISIFVKILIQQDPKDSSINRLILDQVLGDSHNLDMYLRDPLHFYRKLLTQKNYVRSMMQFIGMKEESNKYATEILNFMTELAKVMATPADEASNNYKEHDVTIWELQNLTDPDVKHWNWTTYMNALFEQTDVIIDPKNDSALIRNMDYFKALPLVLSKVPQGVTARYLWWVVFSRISPQTLEHFRDYVAFLGKYTDGFESKQPTWHGCTKFVRRVFKMAVTAAYLEKHFDDRTKKHAIEMWADVRSSFDEMLTEYEWMDDETKEHARRKLLDVNPLIGYPEWITDPEKLEEYYKEYEVIEGSLSRTYTNIKSIERKRYLNHWRQPPDRDIWFYVGTEVNTVYTPNINAMIISAGFLHEPLYGNAAEALNYGAAGSMMSHEVTHIFDSYSQRYDENRTFHKWWSEEARKHYKENVDCVVKQYSGYEVTELGKNVMVDGLLTESENVADNGGLAIAFKAYKKLKARSQPQPALPGLVKYTDEQLFFIGFGQIWCDSFTDARLKNFVEYEPHSPGRFRVNGALQNSAEFAKAWKCPSGSLMNPEKKCTVW